MSRFEKSCEGSGICPVFICRYAARGKKTVWPSDGESLTIERQRTFICALSPVVKFGSIEVWGRLPGEAGGVAQVLEGATQLVSTKTALLNVRVRSKLLAHRGLMDTDRSGQTERVSTNCL